MIEKNEFVCFYIGEILNDFQLKERRKQRLLNACERFCEKNNCTKDTK